MCEAMMAYNEGNYSQAVALLYPLRYQMVDIGGSDAQVSITQLEMFCSEKCAKTNQTARLLLHG